MSVEETTSSGEIEAFENRRHEVLGLMMGTLTLLSILALSSFAADPLSSRNLIGPVGVALASGLITVFGIAAWWVPLELGLLTLRLFSGAQTRFGLVSIATTLVFVFFGCALIHISLGDMIIYDGHLAGGAIGELLGEVLRSLLGTVGTYVVGTAIMLVAILLRSPWSLGDVAFEAREALISIFDRCKENLYAIVDAWHAAKQIESETEVASGPRIIKSRLQRHLPIEEELEEDGEEYEDDGEYEDDEEYEDDGEYEDDDEYEDEDTEDESIAAKGNATQQPTIVAPAATRQAPKRGLIAPRAKQGSFKLPPTSLLDPVDESEIRIDEATLRNNAGRLTEKLAAYGVQGRVDEIHPGPVVTMYEFEPQSGTKVSKIAGLADDLAMALAAQKVRIVAPIPGKARVGFELPNDDRQTVYLR